MRRPVCVSRNLDSLADSRRYAQAVAAPWTPIRSDRLRLVVIYSGPS